MHHDLLKPRQALNKAFLKVKPVRIEIEDFKANLVRLLDQINETESEEFHKNLVSDFLKKTYYDPDYSINTKGRNDMVIYNGKDAKSPVGVILETKKPTNKAEMLSLSSDAKSIKNVNVKSFQELVLYFLRERISQNNLEVKHLVVTNIYEWFVFDAFVFEKAFAQNRTLVKDFKSFEEGRLSGNTTDFFYKEIASREIDKLEGDFPFTYFDLRDYDKPLRNADKKDDVKLIALFKLLSPEHMLKLPFSNDSNSLDKRFYSEFLHIIGLTETKEGGKKLIGRNKEGERNTGSILEDAIIQLDSLDKISRLDRPSQFGNTQQERLFNVALELTITWINRILFLKLLEAQLITYHKGDRSYSFLNLSKIKSYDDLNSLFFQVLARKYDERNEDVKKVFEKVPYLNSSLFEPTDIEHSTVFVSNLRDDKLIPVFSQTVLKDERGKRLSGETPTLDYLFRFLDAYDFGAEGGEEIQEDNKTLINASVLGLIFEKINGYKDGSIFTPGFVTMYMSRETIRRAVMQKFNEGKGWNCKTFEELKEDLQEEIKAGNRKELRKLANSIINSLRIIDPAVGSGHFLVSVLNELIAIKSELRILVDANHEPLSYHTAEVVNDELIVTDEDGILFQYNPNNKESQRIQEALFHEKQTIIENCLFGVDINPNSVKICRLRLWIELLKNAYYKNATELETLPNIDINIKCGNSLVSRFAIDADLSEALRKSKYSIDSYRMAVTTYRNAQNKEEKREMEHLIAEIKSNFRSEIANNDPKNKKKAKLGGELYNLTMQTGLFEVSAKEKKDRKKKIEKIESELEKLSTEIEEIKNNKIYENAFEWRFEFPEVLNENGDFVGFDVVIGNPPYGIKFSREEKIYFKKVFKTILGKYDSYGFFIEKGLELIKSMGIFGYIIPHTWLTVKEASQTRSLIFNSSRIIEIDKLPGKVFEDATVDTTNLILRKEVVKDEYYAKVLVFDLNFKIESLETDFETKDFYPVSVWKINNCVNLRIKNIENELVQRILKNTKPMSDLFDFSVGVQAYDSYSGQTKETIQNRVFHASFKKDNTYLPELNGGDVGRYFIKPRKESWISYGAWLAHPRTEKYFFNPRILVREITNKGKYKLACCFTNEPFINYKSILNIISPENNIEKLLITLAILNSSFMTWYFGLHSNKADSNSFPRISIYDLKKFPINLRAYELPFNQSIVTNTIEILDLMKADLNSNISPLENRIDQLIYELYGLTEEEIRIVEGGEI